MDEAIDAKLQRLQCERESLNAEIDAQQPSVNKKIALERERANQAQRKLRDLEEQRARLDTEWLSLHHEAHVAPAGRIAAIQAQAGLAIAPLKARLAAIEATIEALIAPDLDHATTP
jgi:hypothetical protein